METGKNGATGVNRLKSMRDEFYKDAVVKKAELLKSRNDQIVNSIKETISNKASMYMQFYAVKNDIYDDIAFLKSLGLDIIFITGDEYDEIAKQTGEIACIIYWGRKEDMEYTLSSLGLCMEGENENKDEK